MCSLTLALVLGACWAEPPDADKPAEPAGSQPAPDPAPPEADPAPPEADPAPPEADAAPLEADAAPLEADATPPEADPEPAAAPGPTFTVIARLLEPLPPMWHCGIVHVTSVVKFEVVRVVEGRFEETILYARVSCPTSPPTSPSTRTREFRWTVGDTYELTLHAAGMRRLGAPSDEPDKLYELFLIDAS
jgi:hypothetical protein